MTDEITVASPAQSMSDPSPLTIARIDHEISGLKELLTAKDAVVSARLSAMDKAVQLLEKFPTAIDVAIGNLQALHRQKIDDLQSLHEEKFIGVGTRFTELNTRLTEGDKYKQTALDAALKAAQTLVDIQNLNFKETIKKTEELFTKQIEGLQETVDDLKSLVRGQTGMVSGVHQGQTTLIGWFTAAIMALIAVGAVVEGFHR